MFDFTRYATTPEHLQAAVEAAKRGFGGVLYEQLARPSDKSPTYRGFVKVDGLAIPMVAFLKADREGNQMICLNLANSQAENFVAHKQRFEAQEGTSVRRWAAKLLPKDEK